MIGKTDTFQKSLAIELEEVEPGFSQSEPQASSACKPSHDPRGEVGKPSTPPTSIPASTLSNQSADTKKSYDKSDSGHQDSGCSARECESVCSEPRVIKSDAATDDIVDITQSQDSAFAKSDGDLVESVAVAEASSSPTNAPFLELTKPRTADSENKINEKEGSPGTSGVQLHKPKFVKSRRVTEETRFYPSATSTPYHGNVYKPSPPRRIVHSIRPVTGITAVRLNRTYELRFTENHEKKCLIDARRVSYKLYMSTARVLKRIPTIELGAGFP